MDVGVVCLRLGPVAERRGVARKLAAELIHRADQLMYDAKRSKAAHVHPTAVRVARRRARRAPGCRRKVRGQAQEPLKRASISAEFARPFAPDATLICSRESRPAFAVPSHSSIAASPRVVGVAQW